MSSGPKILAPLLPNIAVNFDPEAFDNLIRAHGVRLEHFKAIRCPIGLSDVHDIRKSHSYCDKCSNGFLYSSSGILTASFLSNNKDTYQSDAGSVDESGVHVTVPRFYDDNPEKQVRIIPFDRFYMVENSVTVPNWQLNQRSMNGIDKLRFPVEEVEWIMDSNGKEYTSDDYTIENGLIVWGPNRPPLNSDMKTGGVYSIRYKYRPYYYATRLGHEIRIVNSENTITGVREAHLMGQQIHLQREYIFENRQNNVDSPIEDLRASRIPEEPPEER